MWLFRKGGGGPYANGLGPIIQDRLKERLGAAHQGEPAGQRRGKDRGERRRKVVEALAKGRRNW